MVRRVSETLTGVYQDHFIVQIGRNAAPRVLLLCSGDFACSLRCEKRRIKRIIVVIQDNGARVLTDLLVCVWNEGFVDDWDDRLRDDGVSVHGRRALRDDSVESVDRVGGVVDGSHRAIGLDERVLA